MTIEVVITRTAKISLREDGILQFVYLPQAQESLADAQENVRAGERLSPGRRPLLVDIRPMQHIEREARAYYSGLQSITARALLVGSPVTRVIANFFISINRPVIPTKLFTSETEAVVWLRNFVEAPPSPIVAERGGH